MVYSQDMQKGSTFDEISGIFPDNITSLRPEHCAVWEPEIAGIKSSRCWPMSYHSLHHATLSISLGPDFQFDSNGTIHLIFRKHPGKIFVYSCLSPAIKVAI